MGIPQMRRHGLTVRHVIEDAAHPVFLHQRLRDGVAVDLAFAARFAPQPVVMLRDGGAVTGEGAVKLGQPYVPICRIVEVVHRDAAADIKEEGRGAVAFDLVDQGERLQDCGDAILGAIAVEVEVQPVEAECLRRGNAGGEARDLRQRKAETGIETDTVTLKSVEPQADRDRLGRAFGNVLQQFQLIIIIKDHSHAATHTKGHQRPILDGGGADDPVTRQPLFKALFHLRMAGRIDADAHIAGGLHVAETFIRLARKHGQERQAIIGHAIGQLRDIAAEGIDRLDVERRTKAVGQRVETGAILQQLCHPVFQPRAQGHDAVAGAEDRWGDGHKECSSALD